MLPGFNHNIKQGGITFHVQTEDMGKKVAAVITHVFVGGNIIDTSKTDYRDILTHEMVDEVVKEIMEEQHKRMIKKVLKGAYNNHPLVIKEGGGKKIEQPKKEETKIGDGKKEESLDEIVLEYLIDETMKKEK